MVVAEFALVAGSAISRIAPYLVSGFAFFILNCPRVQA
jgi:hypothetical protein